jgi:hypothetical protein
MFLFPHGATVDRDGNRPSSNSPLGCSPSALSAFDSR